MNKARSVATKHAVTRNPSKLAGQAAARALGLVLLLLAWASCVQATLIYRDGFEDSIPGALILSSRQPAPESVLPELARPEISASFHEFPGGVVPEVHVTLDGNMLSGVVAHRDTFSVTVPETLSEGLHQVAVSVAQGNINTQTSWVFTTASPPRISSVLPQGLSPQVPTEISATMTDMVAGVDPQSVVVRFGNPGIAIPMTLDGTLLRAPLPALSQGNHVFQIEAADRVGNQSLHRGQFQVGTRPILHMLSPAPSGRFLAGQTLAVALRADGSGDQLALDSWAVYLDHERIESVSISGAGDTLQAQFELPAQTAGVKLLQAEVRAENGIRGIAGWPLMFADSLTPDMTFLAPASPETTLLESYLVRLRVQDIDGVPPERVTVNGQRARREFNANVAEYQARIKLTPGPNTLTAQADFGAHGTYVAETTLEFDAPAVLNILEPVDFASFGPLVGSPGNATALTGEVARPVRIAGSTSRSVASLTINQQAATLSPDGRAFVFENFFLHEGTNVLGLVAVDEHGRSTIASRTIYVDQTAPILAVDTPETEVFQVNQKVTFSGWVQDVVAPRVGLSPPTVVIRDTRNKLEVQAQVSGTRFVATDVPLAIGTNEFTIRATDAAGNTRTQQLSVSRVQAPTLRLLSVAGDGQSAAVCAVLPKPLQIQLLNASGEPVAGETVRFTVLLGDGSIALDALAIARTDGVNPDRIIDRVTDADGLAQVFMRLGCEARSAGHVVKAEVPESGASAVFSETAHALPATRLLADGLASMQFGPVGGMALEALNVNAFDAHDNAIADAQVQYRLVSGAGAFVASGNILVSQDGTQADARTDSAGVAAVRFKHGNEPGIVRIAAYLQDDQDAIIDHAEFRLVTVAATGGPTRFAGSVLDHTGHPIANAQVSIGRTSLVQSTDAAGKFLIIGEIPEGRIDLFVDGRNAPAPPGSQFPSLHFEAMVVRGANNQLPHPIYLPPVAGAHAVQVGGDQEVVLELPGFDGFSMTIAAHSVTFPDGSRTGPISVTPVHLDRLPMVPQGGRSGFGGIGWTIQPSGTRFDPPIKVSIPNVTGLPAGRGLPMYQWDHDLATFVPMGQGVVTEDRTRIVTIPGTGISKAGWGGGPPPVPPNDANDDDQCESRQTVSVEASADGETTKLNKALSGDSVNVAFSATVTGNCGGQEFTWDFGDGTTGSGQSPTHTYSEAKHYVVSVKVNCPECNESATDTVEVDVMSLKIESAKVDTDEIKITIAPEGHTGTLTVKLVADDDAEVTVFDAEQASGTITKSFKTSTLEQKLYNRIRAKFVEGDIELEKEFNYQFRVLGTYRHTEYNTPSETECTGTDTSIYYSTSSCVFTADTILSGFKTELDRNGNGRSIDQGLLQIEAFCLRPTHNPPADAADRSYRPVTSLTFNGRPINTSTVAICDTHPNLRYDDRILLVGYGSDTGTIKRATDRCPLCCDAAHNGGQDGHIDNYTDAALDCGRTAVDLGNYLTIKLID